MANTVITNGYVSINSVDVSDQAKSLSLPMSIEELDATTFGSGGVMVHEPGLRSFSAEVEFNNDFTDDLEDEDFFALWANRTKFAVAFRVDATSIGAANPEYQFTAFISAWNPIQGAVGQIAGGSMTLTNTTDLTRATS